MKTKSRFSGIGDLVGVFVLLLVLFGASAVTVAWPPAPWKTAFSLAIAAAKTVLIALVFMKLRDHRGLTRVFAIAGLFWLAIFITLVLADYMTRG